MKRNKTPSGLRPLTKLERRRIARDNQRCIFPHKLYQRFEATIQLFESRLREVRKP